jgi:hypothetical protein
MTSSTSSSDAGGRPHPLRLLPWAGLLALALLLAGDRFAFAQRALWEAVSERDPFGVASARLALLEARGAPPGAPRLFVVGPSRVVDGFSAPAARAALPGALVAKLAHPRFDPFVVRCLVPEILEARPAVVAFVWSELDTHRPLRLEPVPGSSAASLAAVGELVELAGWRFAVEHRTSLYRLAGTSALEVYRHRHAFLQAGLDDLRHFALEPRLAPRRALPRIFGEIVYWGPQPERVSTLLGPWPDHVSTRPTPVSTELRSRILGAFGPGADRRFVDLSIDFVAELQAGDHVRLQRAFIERSVALLRAAGSQVVLVEGPVHPLAGEIYDTGLRAEFLAFAEGLVRDHGVHLVPLERMPRFAPSDFKDLFHTRGAGTAKLTHAITRAAGVLLDPASASARSRGR